MNCACPDLCGGCPVMAIPTAIPRAAVFASAAEKDYKNYNGVEPAALRAVDRQFMIQ